MSTGTVGTTSTGRTGRATARRRTIVAVATVLALTGATTACGGDDESGGGPSTTTGTTDVASTTPTAGRGWIGGEPNWAADGVAAELAEGEMAATAADAGGMAFDDAETSDEATTRAEEPIPVEPDGGVGDGAEPLPPIDEPPPDTPLRAGSVDDNADYPGFLEYLERIAGLGIVLRDLDLSSRTIVTVTGANGLPAAGVEVVASSGGASASLRTTADGTVRFHPGLYGMAADAAVTFAVDEVTAEATPGSDVEMSIAADGGATAPVPLDVLFLLDATGSMGDEIDRLKATIDTVAQRVSALEPAPDVRFAMTLYRDEGDAFVAATYDFTGDVGEFQTALTEVVADGGGDYPEALEEGLAEALAAPSWRDPAQAVQLVFLVADAPPQIARQVATPYPDSIRTAVGRGIKVFPVASSESDDQAEAVFRQLAQATGAPFVFLSYGAGGAATGGSTDIQSTDYEELALDELVVRLVAEELDDLTGGGVPVTVPTTVAPTTTNPEGQ